ncbi:hypothetical protein F2Q68_00032622 [Brassica cretica]|uniref:Uncharacterized protein n=1 Tax=Brassica cretica TaxID=69181 RepID=A0A8S9G5L6_BRACR|nr:hypothetical protein F2Q68_00032622 [Brassica cretica]
MGLESRFRSLWAVFRLEAFTTISFDKERTFRDSIEGLTRVHGLVSSRHFGRAWSLRSDRAGRALGRYVATELCRARSLPSNRAGRAFGHYVATKQRVCAVVTQ